jgi:2-keto-4-pentenoate hydratase/2-oxohepta-3-ene-1,7-dioic acid hydratase in catechol pathway
MRIARFSHYRKVHYGIIKGELVDLISQDPFVNSDSVIKQTGQAYPLADVKLLAPCLPSKIVCLGLNYRPHAREFNLNPPSAPLIFLKPPSAVIGPEEPIVLPRTWRRVDHECELAVVIGKTAKYVPEARAREYVLGYTCLNDVTERQLQKEDGQWTRSKGFDTFAPIGPWIETEVDPDDLQIETLLNGEIRQTGRTSELVFGISSLISFISSVMTLLPGDVIATGTPAGISPMKPGDVVEIKIEKIGTLRNPVVAPEAD